MQIYFAGAEVPSHMSVLRECGVERVAINIANLARQSVTLNTWASKARLEGLEWVLYADSPNAPVDAVLELLQGCEVAPEIITGPVNWYETTWLANSDLLFLPTWDASDPTILRDYTQNYDGVTLPDAVVDNPTAVRQARASIPRLGQLAAITGRSKGIERFDTLVSSAWWAVQKYGETQVWVGNRLVRLNSEDKRTKREKYAAAIQALGCDPEKLMEDDSTEALRCAVLSWQSLENHLARGPVHALSEVTISDTVVPDNVVSIAPGVARPTPRPRHHLLPVMRTGNASVTSTDEEGNEVEEQHPVISVAAESLRQCSTCSLAVACPSFTPGSVCSYQIPVEIKSKTQLVAVMRSVTEIQTQRILMGRFAEEIQGEPNPDLGREMDRLFTMFERWRNIEDNRDTVKMTLESKGSGQATMGVLSRLFGTKVGQNATLLENPIDSNDIIDEMTDE